MDIQEIEWEDVHRPHVVQDRENCRAVVSKVMNIRIL
jgi:hypothetical protein